MAFVVVTGTLPSGSLMRLVEGEGLFITSPEHTFAMMASKIDEVGLVLLGSELRVAPAIDCDEALSGSASQPVR